MPLARPLVSVILPTFDRADVLGRAIGSVLDQSFTEFELIVVDDDSKDATTELLAGYSDPRLEIIRRDRNCGGAAARNFGISKARGKYIAFQDSDDEWLSGKLAKQVEILQARGPEVGVVYCIYTRDTGATRRFYPDSSVEPRSGDLSRALLAGNFIGTPTVLVRREFLEEVGGFWDELPRFHDWELMLRLAARTAFALVDEPLVKAYDRPGSITRNPRAGALAFEMILRRHDAMFRSFSDILSGHYLSVGHLWALAGDAAAARRWFTKAATERPLTPKPWFALLLSGLGTGCYRFAVNMRNAVARPRTEA